jgi:hypothetical protein
MRISHSIKISYRNLWTMCMGSQVHYIRLYQSKIMELDFAGCSGLTDTSSNTEATASHACMGNAYVLLVSSVLPCFIMCEQRI